MLRARRLFVISDLHLGGRPKSPTSLGFQICNAYKDLTEFVEWVRLQPPDGSDRELVINGDMIDFLAEDDYEHGAVTSEWTRDDTTAVQKFDQVVRHTRGDSDYGFFDALAALLRDGHRVTIILGNHDVELSLPRVRARLEEILGDSGLLRLIYDGEAYTFGPVMIEHGNRYDAWNILNFDRLREERSVRSRRLPLDERADRYFRPPAGTLLVTRFMNPLKQRYRFIDLLKPETGAVLPLLLTLEPSLDLGLRALLKAAPIIRGVARAHFDADGGIRDPGELGGAGTSGEMTLDDVLLEVLGTESHLFMSSDGTERAGELGSVGDLMKSIERFAERLRALGSEISHLASIKLAPNDDVRRRRLRAALAATAARDRSFDPTVEAKEYRDAALMACRHGGFEVVVFGHTHLPKQIELVDDQGVRYGCYLNTGTWADVIRLDQLPQPVDEAFLTAVRENQLAEYTVRYLSYAEIEIQQGRVRQATIRSFCGPQRPREPILSAAL
ncbi:MAG: metallophosphoesterase [Nannocystaceae bacterium]